MKLVTVRRFALFLVLGVLFTLGAIEARERVFPRTTQSPYVPLLSASDLPTSNPYRVPLDRWRSLSYADRSALKTWSFAEKASGADGTTPLATISAERREVVADLNAMILHASTFREATQWPLKVNRDVPQDFGMDYLQPLDELGQFMSAGNTRTATGEAITNYLAIAQFARQLREGPVLVHQFMGINLEELVITQIARRLNEFTATELDEISKRWAALRPARPVAEVLGRDREYLFKPILDDILVSGLTALIAERKLADKSSLDVSSREAIARLRGFLVITAQRNSDRDDVDINPVLVALLTNAETNKKGVSGYRESMLADYDTFFASCLNRAQTFRVPDISARRPAVAYPLSNFIFPYFEVVGRSLTSAAVTSEMFEAAVALRRQQIGGKPIKVPVDTSSPDRARFFYEKTSDGGFIIGSVFETNGGRPLRFKYAAPDAGLIR